jgi:hypothetical protein
MQFIGIDPGGTVAMGWCVLTVHNGDVRIKSGTCTGVDRCMDSMISNIDGQPRSAGIDAPLYWTQGGDRVADRRIRSAVTAKGGRGGTVAHVNSLRGACLVQGIFAAVAVAQRWPSIKVTEAHPKALIRLRPQVMDFFGQHVFVNEHERDAALGAYTARAYYDEAPGWVDWIQRETDPFRPSGRGVAYWFPECL